MNLGVSFSRFIIEQQRLHPGASGDFTLLLSDIVKAIKAISFQVSHGPLHGILGKTAQKNIHGERQAKLDLIAHDLIVDTVEYSGLLAAMASEELDDIYQIPSDYPKGRYLLVFDPLDGSSNIATNVSVGTIFALYKCQEQSGEVDASTFFQKGVKQVCAGYAIYGPATMLVFTTGHGVHGFTLDRQVGEFLLTHPDIKIPAGKKEFAINMSNQHFWSQKVKQYVKSNTLSNSDASGPMYNMRWIASLVAEVHRILMRGGIFLYPEDERPGRDDGHLRLLYEANPMSMIVENAGGKSITGSERVLELQPKALHQKVPLVLGCGQEVDRFLSQST